MSSEETNRIKLVNASKKANDKKIQHVLITLSSDGRIHFNGSTNLVANLKNDRNFKNYLEKNLRENFSLEENAPPEEVTSYPLLPCVVGSSEWKTLPIDKFRSHLTMMLNSTGIVRSGKRKSHGAVKEPKGWPNSIVPWSSFKGASRSALKKTEIADIIVKLLEAAGIDPANHVEKPATSNEAEKIYLEDLFTSVMDDDGLVEFNDNNVIINDDFMPNVIEENLDIEQANLNLDEALEANFIVELEEPELEF